MHLVRRMVRESRIGFTQSLFIQLGSRLDDWFVISQFLPQETVKMKKLSSFKSKADDSV